MSTTTTPPVVQLDSADRKPVTTTVLIPRTELDRELGDFAALSQDVQVATQPEGGFRLAQVRSGSFFERIGLRTNDVVLRIDGRPINGVEDVVIVDGRDQLALQAAATGASPAAATRVVGAGLKTCATTAQT